MVQSLHGRTALITGATSGIGRAIAEAYAAAGAHVAVSGRDAARGAEVVEGIRASGGRADFVAADLGASIEAVTALANAATGVLGRVDILVNNAGVYPPTQTLSLDEATFDAVIAVNVRAPVFLTQAIAGAMVERGEGVIVNVSSWIATVGVPTGALYAASKATLDQLTRSWAAELGPSGVRVNAVAPGITMTEGNAGHGDFLGEATKRFPAGRLARPEEIASAAVFLASDNASYLHGETLYVDGGAASTRTL
ncbi:SDR family NAD(P)-dependent oxidoreductase [Solirubrobacter soli]|uniref:SDR family NAD(P)-dependent oxidoreductase n=1 Tax=Solirubrobacter soli TaxID=363832 RepID=UPI00040717AF|nr:SDR family oxidoreductase [Solirubrobacter soli]